MSRIQASQADYLSGKTPQSEALIKLVTGQAMENGHRLTFHAEVLPAGKPFARLMRASVSWDTYALISLMSGGAEDLLREINEGGLPHDQEAAETLLELREAVSDAAAYARKYRLRQIARERANWGIRSPEKKRLADIVAKRIANIAGVQEVYLFGSVAKGTDGETSDIDFYVRVQEDWLKRHSEFQQAVCESLDGAPLLKSLSNFNFVTGANRRLLHISFYDKDPDSLGYEGAILLLTTAAKAI